MGLAFVCLHRKRSPSRLSARSARLLSLGHSLYPGRTNIYWGKKRTILTRRKVRKVWRTIEIFPLEIIDPCASAGDGARSHLILPSLNNRHHFLTFPSFIVPSPYTSAICLSISAEWTFLACEYPIISRTSQVSGFSIFVFLLNDYSERRKSWHRNTQYMCYPCHTEDEWSL